MIEACGSGKDPVVGLAVALVGHLRQGFPGRFPDQFPVLDQLLAGFVDQLQHVPGPHDERNQPWRPVFLLDKRTM